MPREEGIQIIIAVAVDFHVYSELFVGSINGESFEKIKFLYMYYPWSHKNQEPKDFTYYYNSLGWIVELPQEDLNKVYRLHRSDNLALHYIHHPLSNKVERIISSPQALTPTLGDRREQIIELFNFPRPMVGDNPRITDFYGNDSNRSILLTKLSTRSSQLFLNQSVQDIDFNAVKDLRPDPYLRFVKYCFMGGQIFLCGLLTYYIATKTYNYLEYVNEGFGPQDRPGVTLIYKIVENDQVALSLYNRWGVGLHDSAWGIVLSFS